jgi:hypothetical protein
MKMPHKPSGLEGLVGYELRSSVRYGREFCLVLAAAAAIQVEVKRLLEPILRDSDELFEVGARVAILMGTTNRAGALSAIRRFKYELADQADLRFAVVTFPEDGTSPQELIATAHRRLDTALIGERGAVVASE